MKKETLLVIMSWLLLSVTHALAKLPQRQANLAQLLEPKTRLVETKRLMGIAGSSSPEIAALTQEQWEKNLQEIYLIECPQKSGQSIYLLLTNYDRSSEWKIPFSMLSEQYPTDGLDELFQPKVKATKGKFHLTNNEPLIDLELTFFDHNGKEIHPFGGNNLIRYGYILDLDGDGILERVESTNWGVKSGYSVESLLVKTIEPQPKELLHVVYNWHPHDSDDSNEWFFHLQGRNQNGTQEIVFSPSSPNETSTPPAPVSYYWSPEKQDFIGPISKKGDHYKRIRKTQGHTLEKEGELFYSTSSEKLKAEAEKKASQPVTKAELMARPLHALPDFKAMTDEQLDDFFSSDLIQAAKYDWGSPAVFPPEMRHASPKKAALLFAKANQSPTNRQGIKLALDDRNSAQPPTKGWISYTQNSAACYTYVERLWAISLDDNKLLYFSNSSNGVVGRNPLLDATGYDVRLISLSEKETRHLSGLLWWLNRIRSKKITQDEAIFHMSSSADGSCDLSEYSNNLLQYHYQGMTYWYGGFSKRWDDHYTKEVCGNLSGQFCALEIPKILGTRWSSHPDLKHRNLTTPDEVRMEERHEPEQITLMTQRFNTILAYHEKNSVHPKVLKWIARISADLGIQELQPQLQKLSTNLNPISSDERKLKMLDAELEGRHSPRESQAKPGTAKETLYNQFKEQARLRKEIAKHPSPYLREPLALALKKLAILNKPQELSKMALSDDYQRFWAQQQLRRLHFGDYLDLLYYQAQTLRNPRQKEQAFDLLIKIDPSRALDLSNEYSPPEKAELCLSLFKLYQENLPQKLDNLFPLVLAKAKNPKTSWEHRHRSTRLLTHANFPQHQAEIYPLLLAIAHEKKAKDDSSFDSVPRAEAIQSLVTWPKATEAPQWRIIKAAALAETVDFSSEDSVFQSLLDLSHHHGKKERREIIEFLNNGLLNSSGLVDNDLEFILSNNLSECLPYVERLATASSKEPQSNHAHSGQSNTSFPIGRESYHLARHARALWTPQPSEIQARIWTAYAIVHPTMLFQENGLAESNTLNSLGKSLQQKIKQSKPHYNNLLKKKRPTPDEDLKNLRRLLKQTSAPALKKSP